jgi:hypothetical protein
MIKLVLVTLLLPGGLTATVVGFVTGIDDARRGMVTPGVVIRVDGATDIRYAAAGVMTVVGENVDAPPMVGLCLGFALELPVEFETGKVSGFITIGLPAALLAVV